MENPSKKPDTRIENVGEEIFKQVLDNLNYIKENAGSLSEIERLALVNALMELGKFLQEGGEGKGERITPQLRSSLKNEVTQLQRRQGQILEDWSDLDSQEEPTRPDIVVQSGGSGEPGRIKPTIPPEFTEEGERWREQGVHAHSEFKPEMPPAFLEGDAEQPTQYAEQPTHKMPGVVGQPTREMPGVVAEPSKYTEQPTQKMYGVVAEQPTQEMPGVEATAPETVYPGNVFEASKELQNLNIPKVDIKAFFNLDYSNLEDEHLLLQLIDDVYSKYRSGKEIDNTKIQTLFANFNIQSAKSFIEKNQDFFSEKLSDYLEDFQEKEAPEKLRIIYEFFQGVKRFEKFQTLFSSEFFNYDKEEFDLQNFGIIKDFSDDDLNLLESILGNENVSDGNVEFEDVKDRNVGINYNIFSSIESFKPDKVKKFIQLFIDNLETFVIHFNLDILEEIRNLQTECLDVLEKNNWTELGIESGRLDVSLPKLNVLYHFIKNVKAINEKLPVEHIKNLIFKS